MSSGLERCDDCRFFVVYRHDKGCAGYENSGYGWCHRHAPMPLQWCQDPTTDKINDPFEHPIWPMVEAEEDWCGEWKPKRRKKP